MALPLKNLASLVVLLVVCALVVVSILRAKKGTLPPLRKLAALEAIESAVARAVEMDRPVLAGIGRAPLQGTDSILTLAGLDILRYISELCAKYNAKMIVPIATPEAIPVAAATITEAYAAEGRKEAPETVRFIPGDLYATGFSFHLGVVGILERERPAANIMFGAFYAETLMVLETGHQVGAMQIAGTALVTQIPFIVACCDYYTIGEEIFAAAAYVSKEPTLVGSIEGQDYSRIALVALLLATTIMQTIGLPWLVNLLKM